MEQEPSRQKPIRTLEELAAMQRAHDEEMQGKIEAERDKEQAQAALALKVKEDLARRSQILARMQELRKTMDAMGGVEEIGKHIEASEKLREEKEANVRALEPLRLELEQVHQRIQGIENIIRSATASIAPEILSALKEEEARAQSINQEMTPMVDKIQSLQAQQISVDQVSEYERVRSEMAELHAQLTEIEGEPITKTIDGEQVKVMEGAVNERLVEEAEMQEQVRETIIREALRQIEKRDADDPKVKFVRELCERFLSEEFEASAITALQDDSERAKAMRDFTSGIMRGMEISTDRYANEEHSIERQKLVYKGLLLKNLIGRYGNANGLVNLLQHSEMGGYLSRKSPQETGEGLSLALRKHLGTLNFMRGTAAGISTLEHKRSVVSYVGEWQGFDSDYNGFSHSAFLAPQPEKPIFPRDADEATLAAIKEEFERDKEKAKKIEEKLVLKERADLERKNEELQAEIIKAEAELAKLQETLKRVGEAQATIKSVGKELRQHDLHQDIQTALNVVKRALQQEEILLEKATSDKENAGTFQFAVKKLLKGSIERHQKEVARLSSLLGVIDRLSARMKEANSIIQNEASHYNLTLAIDDFGKKLVRLRKEMQEVQAALMYRSHTMKSH